MRLVLAADYPSFFQVLWTVVVFFAWVAWIWLLVVILSDLFRRRDVGGWAKAAWVVFLLVLPFLGVLAYLIAQHDGMAERRQQDFDSAQRQFDARVQQAVTQQDGAASEIEKAARLRDQGTITQAEFEQIKSKTLAAA